MFSQKELTLRHGAEKGLKEAPGLGMRGTKLGPLPSFTVSLG
jgi:hypothetical protein